MRKQILILALPLLVLSCGGENEKNDTYQNFDSLSLYNQSEILFIRGDALEQFIQARVKAKQIEIEDMLTKYEEYNAVKKWFETSNAEFLENDEYRGVFFSKILKAETTYKDETATSYFTTPDKGLRYCYFNEDYIYFIEFEYDGIDVSHSVIERLSLGLRFEDFEKITLNTEGKIISKAQKEDYRYSMSYNEDGFTEISYYNMWWELFGNEKRVTTLTTNSKIFGSTKHFNEK